MDIQTQAVAAKGEGAGGELEWEAGVSRCKLLYTELYSISLDKPQWKKRTHIKRTYITESLCYTADLNIINQLYFIKKILELEKKRATLGYVSKGMGILVETSQMALFLSTSQLRANWTQPQNQGHPGSKG